MKRQRSPSPPPSSSSTYQGYGHSEPKYPHTADSKYTHGDPKYPTHADTKFAHADTKFAHADPKYLTSYSAKAGQPGHLYTAQHAQPGDFSMLILFW